jgi:hypothetical protein
MVESAYKGDEVMNYGQFQNEVCLNGSTEYQILNP